jgi:hypothetical protein
MLNPEAEAFLSKTQKEPFPMLKILHGTLSLAR